MNRQTTLLFILTVLIVSAIATVAIVFYILGFSSPMAWIVAVTILIGDGIAAFIILRKFLGGM